ncbi:Phosphotransferase enzyme family [Aspergillus sclerotialis]|uniref:Phosphotransferase enzyme family n=1 Tax=Aspergillus sclerotialis TaxID=2070753 RepID=A0A3A3A4E7_9EURO|nr:Phosphotransferase enzyme family [Aspergillus sclerotialis]
MSQDQSHNSSTTLKPRQLIKKLVARHLGLGSADACHVVDVEDWIHGSFNVCIRVDVIDPEGNLRRQVMIRFPLRYRIGEDYCPGNADEKVRCEVGTYAWLKENCPAYLECIPFFARNIQRLRRWLLQILRYPVPSLYAENHSKNRLGTPYIVIEYIDQSRGKMLSESWEQRR